MEEDGEDEDSLAREAGFIVRCWNKKRNPGPQFAKCIKDKMEDEWDGYFFVLVAEGPITGFDTRAHTFAKFHFGKWSILIWNMYRLGES